MLNPVGNDRCFNCHGLRGTKTTIDVNGQQKSIYVDKSRYERSLHGRLACTSCHIGFKADAHTPDQTANWLQTAKLNACHDCHAQEFNMYRSSFHGNLVFNENSKVAPLCADCHMAHDVVAPNSLAFRMSIPALCSKCHSARETSFLDNYHGKAFYLGRTDAAVCTDCHGGHKILNQSNPQSTISKQNIIATCGKCHPGSNRNFTGFLIHVNPRDPRSSLPVWTFYMAYILLITVVFTFGGVHSGLYIYRGIKDGLYRRHH